MAGDNENINNPNQQANKQQSGAQVPARRPPQRTIWLFTTPGLIYIVLWSVSALLTAIALINLFTPVPANCRAPDLFISQCWDIMRATGWPIWTLGFSFIGQFIISVGVRVVKDARTVSALNTTNYLLNFLGLYWLACVFLNIKGEEIRAVVASIVRLSIGATLVLALISLASYYWEYFQNRFLDAATTPPQKGGK